MASAAERSEGPRPILCAACWALFLGLYLVLAGSLSWAEVAAGALAAAIAVLGTMRSGDRNHLGRMRWAWWPKVVGRVAARLPGACLRVHLAAVRRRAPAGSFHSLPFAPGGDDPIAGSRRALVLAASSIAPNSYAIIVNETNGTLLSHQLVGSNTAPREDPQWPI